MTDWSKKIKALENRIEQLESYTARQKRALNDLLANLDDDNMSETLLREKKQMKDKDIQLQSMIEQTAGSITMQVKKTFVGSSGIRQYENNKPPYHPLEEDLVPGWADYLWENVGFKNEKRYYFWNELVGGWSYTDTTEIQSLFVQTADGFYLSKEVVIDGNLITRGKITASEIEGGTITGSVINTTKDVNVGQDVHLRQQDSTFFTTGGIYFDDNNGNALGRVAILDASGPCLYIHTPSRGRIEITTGNGSADTGGDLTLRGFNVRIGSKDGQGEIYVNGRIVADRTWVLQQISNAIGSVQD